MPPQTKKQTEELINKEAGALLTLTKELAKEAQTFAVKNSDIKEDRTDKENYPPEARMYFLYIKTYQLWEMAAEDLQINYLDLIFNFDQRGRAAYEVEDRAKMDLLEAFETIKNNFDDVLDAAWDRVGYTVSKLYNSRCLKRRSCSNGELRELNQLFQDFAKNVEDAINN